MEERRWNDDVKLTDFAEMLKKNKDGESTLFQAIQNKANKSVALHKPDSVITTKSGAQYQVLPDGSWKKITEKGK